MPVALDSSLTDSMEAHLIETKFVGVGAEELLQWAAEEFGDTLAISTSFGIQSAVTLHLMNQIRPDVKVIWVDTGYLNEATYRYAMTLTQRLNLNLKVYESRMTPPQMESRFGRLWESDRVEDLNLYDQIRKVEPMQRALEELGVRGWVSGLRAEQTEFRKQLPTIKRTGSRYRIYPILKWTQRDVYQYMVEHNLPQHPLFHQGYVSVGDAHSTRPLSASDSHERNTRFRGVKQECGLHTN